MNGKQESLVIEDKLKIINDFITNYYNSVGLQNVKQNTEIEQYLSTSQNEMRKMTGEECLEAATMLAQEALHIQLEINRQKAILYRCTKYLNFIVAQNIDNCGSNYTPYEYRKYIAIRNNDVASQLSEMVNMINTKVEGLNFAANHLVNISDRFKELGNRRNS
jgi:hypothetical protein